MAAPLTKAGRYQIVSELGRGSMGVVYQGFDPVIGRTVAIKTMLAEGLGPAEFEDFKARFQREAQAAGILNHPNIVTVYDFGEDSGFLYQAMEFLEGKSLQDIVEAEGVLPVERILPIYEQTCAALDHAHTHRIIHRDVKPANIMVLDSGLVKVTDFGIAKMLATGMTQAGQILGTPNYMSPEQVRGRQIDGRSDIFSLGVILYELVTGEKPFGGQNITTVIYRIINENPIPPRELDSTIHAGLSYVIQKSLAKSPDERYQTCRELAQDLKNYKKLGDAVAPSETVVIRVPPLSPPPGETRQVAPVRPQPTAPPTEPAMTPGDQPISRPVSIHVIPPVKPSPPRKSSPTAWVLLLLLLAVGLGGGYYYFFMMTPPPSQVVEPQPPPEPPPIKPPPPPPMSGGNVLAHQPGDLSGINAAGIAPGEAPPSDPGAIIKTLEKQAAQNPKDPGPRLTLANYLFDQQQWPQAIEWYQQALALNPENVNARTDLGTTYFNAGRPEDALGEYAKSLEYDPQHEATIFNSIVVNLEGPRDLAAAYRAWEQLSRANPDYPGMGALKERLDVALANEPPVLPPTDQEPTPGGEPAAPKAVVAKAAPSSREPGSLVVSSNIPGARITLDGKSDPTWVTPFTLPDVSPGYHSLVVAKSGFTTAERTVNIEPGRALDLSVELHEPSGEVNIITTPPGIEVLIDGRPAGRTPLQRAAAVGEHSFTLRAPGMDPYKSSFEIRHDGFIITKRIDLSGAVAASTGVVEIHTNPPGARIAADGRRVGGTTPTSVRLSAGRHMLAISLDGHQTLHRDVEVPADGTVEINERLNPR